MTAKKDTSRKRFVNHLGQKLQSRKEQRKLKRLKKGQKVVNNKNCNVKAKGTNKKGSGLDRKGLSAAKSQKFRNDKFDKIENNEQERGGFQISSSNKERMARLQEYVNQQAGKITNPATKASSSSKPQSKNDKQGNLIKNEKKLLGIRRDQDDDTREINKLARLLQLRPEQKKKVAPIFADDFKDILADIEEGSMSRANGYSDKCESKKSVLFDSESESDSGDSDSESIIGFMKKKGERMEGSPDHRFYDAEINHHLPVKNDDVNDDHENDNSEDDDSDDEDSDDGEDIDFDDNELEEENSDQEGLFDMEAEESSGEESPQEEPFHDDTKEYEYAFEAGGCISKGEVLDDIDAYSSNSDDNADLEGFIVDDDFVEYDSSDQELPSKKKRRRVMNSDSEDEQNAEPESTKSYFASPQEGLGHRLRLASDSDSEERNISPQRKKRKSKPIVDDEDPSFEVETSDLKLESDNLASDNTFFSDSTKSLSSKKLKRKKKVDMQSVVKSIDDVQVREKEMESEDKNSDKECKQSDKVKKKKKLRTDTVPTSEGVINGKKKKKKLKKNAHEVVVSVVQGGGDDNVKKKKKKKRKIEDADSMDLDDTNIKKKKRKVKNEVSAEGENTQCDMKNNEDFSDTSMKKVEGDIENVPSLLKKKKKKKKKGIPGETLVTDSNHSEIGENGSCIVDPQVENDTVTEDIYGRLRDKEGNVIKDKQTAGSGKYIPPALRKLQALGVSERKKEQLAVLKRNLKGLVNRLAESNMAGIASQIEGLYLKHSHNDMSDTLCQLLCESLILPTLTPERLVQEHALLIAVLTANIGSEVGAYILTDFVVKIHDTMQEMASDINCKKYDNMLLFVASLFNFRIVGARLIYDILQKLADVFTEKEVELILMVLRTVGFSLRKEDPLALKNFITQIQAQAAHHQAKESANYTRICFMLEIINSIKNNNPSKVPNYDPSHVEHLKKVMKGLIHKGKTLNPIYVTLNDIINSKAQGRWWIVGSAWSGGLKEDQSPLDMEVVEPRRPACMEDEFSEKFKRKAAKLQLTRPPRINIMYVITEGSEDYLDAFDKLLQLKLPGNQEQEIFNVILLCCQKGKVYNEFFSYLAGRMCKFDKKYKRLLQFTVWDKFQELENCKPNEIKNIAKFLAHLIREDGLYITVLKNLSFIEAEAQMVDLVRVILKDLLLHPAGSERVLEIFSRISGQPELQVFSQSLRVFISKFLMSKKKKDMPKYQLLHSRSQEVLELLSTRGGLVF